MENWDKIFFYISCFCVPILLIGIGVGLREKQYVWVIIDSLLLFPHTKTVVKYYYNFDED